MKTNVKMLQTATLFLLGMTLLVSCRDEFKQRITQTLNVPQYMTFAELRSAVKCTTEQPIKNAGKMYYNNNILYVNEVFKGVHIIDNSNPAEPRKISFVEIPGNVDIAVRGNKLYADSYTDLVVLDLTDLKNVTETTRSKNVFAQTFPPTDNEHSIQWPDPAMGVVKSWKVETTVTEQDMPRYYNKGWGGGVVMEEMAFDDGGAAPTNGGVVPLASSGEGLGGSMTRFMLYDNYMYAVTQWSLKVFDITSVTTPQQANEVFVGGGIETIFRSGNRLFIGSQGGMFIYSAWNPQQPSYVSQLQHARACDPVVVEGNTAYVTLRAGSVCQGTQNQLDVIDISDINNPSLLKTYPLNEPYGLGVDGTTLFVCDGKAGLRVFDATSPTALKETQHFADIQAYDVIPLNNVLMLSGESGLRQYDYTDPAKLTLLSTISLKE